MFKRTWGGGGDPAWPSSSREKKNVKTKNYNRKTVWNFTLQPPSAGPSRIIIVSPASAPPFGRRNIKTIYVWRARHTRVNNNSCPTDPVRSFVFIAFLRMPFFTRGDSFRKSRDRRPLLNTARCHIPPSRTENIMNDNTNWAVGLKNGLRQFPRQRVVLKHERYNILFRKRYGRLEISEKSSTPRDAAVRTIKRERTTRVRRFRNFYLKHYKKI